MLDAGDDVPNQTGQIAVDEEDADQQDSREREERSHQDLRDPIGVLEDERERLEKIVLRARLSGHVRHDRSVTFPWKKSS